MSAPLDPDNQPGRWLTLGSAAAMIDASRDRILRRAVPWQPEPVHHGNGPKLTWLPSDASAWQALSPGEDLRHPATPDQSPENGGENSPLI